MAAYAYLVLSVNPVSNEAEVLLNTKITITFAKNINADTLNSNTVRLRKVNGEFVDYTGKYNYQAKTYELTPSAPLEPNTQYQTMIMGGTGGVVSIDGGYLPTAKTYEFVTTAVGQDIKLDVLNLTQDYLFIHAKWNMPAGLGEGEAIRYQVKISSSSNPDAADIWPINESEGYTTATEMTIPYKLDAEQSYYVHIQGSIGDRKTNWITNTILIEPIVTPDTGSPTVPSVPDTGGPGDGSSSPAPNDQLVVLEHAPLHEGIGSAEQIMVLLNDELDPDDIQTDDSLLYVVKAPYKPNLTLLDRMGAYSYKSAIAGTLSVSDESPNVLLWVPAEGFVQDKPYTVILSKDLKGKNTIPLGASYTFGFRSAPEHFHGDVAEIREMLGGASEDITDSFLQQQMKRYSQYACDIWYETSSYDESLHEDGDAPYYINQYVNVQAAISALANKGASSTSSGDESISLGALSIQKSSGNSANLTGMIEVLTGQLKKWEDLIHGHHNRGYAKPVSVVKGESGAAYPDYYTRSELNENFDS